MYSKKKWERNIGTVDAFSLELVWSEGSEIAIVTLASQAKDSSKSCRITSIAESIIAISIIESEFESKSKFLKQLSDALVIISPAILAVLIK